MSVLETSSNGVLTTDYWNTGTYARKKITQMIVFITLLHSPLSFPYKTWYFLCFQIDRKQKEAK